MPLCLQSYRALFYNQRLSLFPTALIKGAISFAVVLFSSEYSSPLSDKDRECSVRGYKKALICANKIMHNHFSRWIAFAELEPLFWWWRDSILSASGGDQYASLSNCTRPSSIRLFLSGTHGQWSACYKQILCPLRQTETDPYASLLLNLDLVLMLKLLS